MFQIQRAHLDGLQRAAADRLFNEIITLLRERFAESVENWPKEKLAGFVRTSINDARRYQMNYDSEITEWACFCFEHESVRPENRPEWVTTEITYPNRTGARKIARIRQFINLAGGELV